MALGAILGAARAALPAVGRWIAANPGVAAQIGTTVGVAGLGMYQTAKARKDGEKLVAAEAAQTQQMAAFLNQQIGNSNGLSNHLFAVTGAQNYLQGAQFPPLG